MWEKNKERKYEEEVQRRIILIKRSATVGCKSKTIKKACLKERRRGREKEKKRERGKKKKEIRKKKEKKKRIEKCCRGTKQMKNNGPQTWVRGRNKNEGIRYKVADSISYNTYKYHILQHILIRSWNYVYVQAFLLISRLK